MGLLVFYYLLNLDVPPVAQLDTGFPSHIANLEPYVTDPVTAVNHMIVFAFFPNNSSFYLNYSTHISITEQNGLCGKICAF